MAVAAGPTPEPVYPTHDRGPVVEFQRRTGYLLAAVVLGHVLLISAQVGSRGGVSVLEAVLFGGLSQAQVAAARVVQGVTGAWGRYVAVRGLGQEVAALREALDRQGVELQHARAQARRASELEAILYLQRTQLPGTLAARVIAADPTAAFRTITVDRGHRDGVRRDMAVLAPAGVVGRVIDEPAAHAAKVQLLVDRSAAAGAVLERTGAGGVVMGTDGDPPLRMEYVNNLADVQVGDLVTTSGLDGIYPRGFVIGRVDRVERGSGLYREIRVRPRVDVSALDAVLILVDRAGTGDESP